MIVASALVASALIHATPALVAPRLVNEPTTPSVESTITMIAPRLYPETYYWAQAAGRLFNYQGAYATGTSRYFYFTVGGNGPDPGLAVTELSGRTGTAVDLTNGNTATQAATAAASAISAVSGWSATSLGAVVTVTGPEALAAADADWDDRGNSTVATDERNGILGMDTHRYDSGSGMVNGPLNTGGGGICVSQHMTVPSGGVRRVYALRVYIGAGWSSASAERARWHLSRNTSNTTPSGNSSALLYDFGQELTTFSADGWHTLWVDSDTLVTIDTGDEIWLTAYGAGTTTTHGVCNNGSASFIGDWTDQNHVLTTSVMPTDATTAAPSAHSGTTSTGYAGVFMARLVVEQAPYAGRAELGSESDPIVVGHHVTFTTDTLDANAVLTQSVVMPQVGPTIPVALDQFVGNSHNASNQPRAFVYDGADFTTNPAQPDIDDATLVRDFGRMTGTDTSQFVRVTGGSATEVAEGAALVWGIVHGGNDGGTVTNISYITGETATRANVDTIDAPMDWIMVDDDAGATDGPEVALIADGSSNFDVNNPGIGSLPATIGTYTVPTTALYFANIGGIRGAYRTAGITVSSGS